MRINTKVFYLVALTAIMIMGCNEPKTQEMRVAKAPSGTITVEEAIVLNKEYLKTRQPLLDSLAGRGENVSSWWSLEDLKNYIAYAEQTAKDKGYVMSGIRIYQGAYPENYEDKEKAGYMTVFLAPTGTKGEQKGSFFNLQDGDGGDLDVPPLNEGHLGNPPHTGYPTQD